MFQKDELRQGLKQMNREMLEMELFECIVLHIADTETTAGEEDVDNTQYK